VTRPNVNKLANLSNNVEQCLFNKNVLQTPRVYIVAQRANRYIVVFHIAISQYRTIFSYRVAVVMRCCVIQQPPSVSNQRPSSSGRVGVGSGTLEWWAAGGVVHVV